jgi:ferredoxin
LVEAMSALTATDIVEQLIERLMVAPSFRGGPLSLALTARRYDLVVGLLCDTTPLLRSCEAEALRQPQLVMRGLGAAKLLSGARRALLVVDDATAASQRLAALYQPFLRDRSVLLCREPLSYPVRETLRERLAQRYELPPERIVVVDAVESTAAARAVAGSRAGLQTVSCVGELRRPSVLQVPVGTSIETLVELCGGSTRRAWVAFENSLYAGCRLDSQSVVDFATRGIVVVGTNHPLAHYEPLEDKLRRGSSCCIGCRQCSDRCPDGGRELTAAPHEIVLRGPSSPILESPPLPEVCGECGLCSVVCPAGIDVASIVRAAHPGCGTPSPLPPARARGKQLELAMGGRLAHALGYSSQWRSPELVCETPTIRSLVVPLFDPAGSPREPLVAANERVMPGQLLSAGKGVVPLRAESALRVVKLDPDDGMVLES